MILPALCTLVYFAQPATPPAALAPAPPAPLVPSAPAAPAPRPAEPSAPPVSPPTAPPVVLPAVVPEGAGLKEVFPGVRLDARAKLVEFDAVISPMLIKDDRAPNFFLEVLACSFNTREHETLVVTRVKPSHLHAALLAIGLKPGSPGSWTLKDGKLVATEPTGDRVSVRFLYALKDSPAAEHDPLNWIISSRDKRGFVDAMNKAGPAIGFVFAGSRFVARGDKAVYDADGAGNVIGLTTFGSEVIGLSRVISPDASVESPQWIVDFSKTPPADTKVHVRVAPAG